MLGWIHDGIMSYVVVGDKDGYMVTGDDFSGWMEDTLELIGKMGLFDICMPDSHNSGMSICQNATLGVSAHNVVGVNKITKREIDVIIQKDGMVVPIEVKSGNTRANSLKSLMKNNKDISYGYKFVDGNIGVSEEGITTLPLYMIAFI